MFFSQFKLILRSIGALSDWDNASLFEPNTIVFGPDDRLYQALNPLDENNDPIPNINKNPTNPVNNTFWVQIAENFVG